MNEQQEKWREEFGEDWKQIIAERLREYFISKGQWSNEDEVFLKNYLS